MTELMNGWLMMMMMDRKKYFGGFPFLFFSFFFLHNQIPRNYKMSWKVKKKAFKKELHRGNDCNC